MANSTAYEVTDCAIVGRTFEEYVAMFDLEPAELEGKRILDCPSGVASFVVTATERGIDAVGADVVYRVPPGELARRCRTDREAAVEQLREKRDLFEWSFYGSPAKRDRYLRRASERFVTDYVSAASSGRYVAAALPSLPFATDSVSVVLSSHLLFLYDDRFDREFHLDSLRELARVATDEVRVYPLQAFDGTQSRHLDGVVEVLEDEGYGVSVTATPFEFLSGSTEMLLVEPA
ncbi:hypothetical protein [Natrarchaeobius oligotrophus]|uniref:Class I SAM-dependent methyltransferase n=1 Tax=Natrarchaeobius chitinivorans TaxID=1679083 RepID=A0A3N6MQC8_NATCH|nr:hypothetical protein [Natrarchaeobius chitinivorans]RQG98441.1 hypothetical protein EA472_17635 [Natrarchaeobius chitinivorans]